MISLYPFHIHISFHLHIFHIFMYRYFYRLRRLPCHLCFFIFFILWHGDGVCFSCGFLVSVLWMFSACSSPHFSFRFSLRSASRSVFRLAFRPVSHVSLLFPPFVSPFGPFPSFRSSPRLSPRLSFRFSVSSVSGGRFVERAVFVSSLWRVVVCSLSCLCAVVAMRVRVSSMWSVQWMAGCWRQCVVSAFRAAGRVACRSARRGAGRGGVCGIWK